MMKPHVRLRLVILAIGALAVLVANARSDFRSSDPRWYLHCVEAGFLDGVVAVVAFACALWAMKVGQWLARLTLGWAFSAAMLALYHRHLLNAFYSAELFDRDEFRAMMIWEIALGPATMIAGIGATLLIYQRRIAATYLMSRDVGAPTRDRLQFSLRGVLVGVFVVAAFLALVRVSARATLGSAYSLRGELAYQSVRHLLIASCRTLSTVAILLVSLRTKWAAHWIAAATGCVMLAIVSHTFAEVQWINNAAAFRLVWDLPAFIFDALIQRHTFAWDTPALVVTELAFVVTLVVTFLLVRWCGYRFVPRSRIAPETRSTVGEGV